MIKIAVLTDSYLGLVAAIAIKIKNPASQICVVGDVVSAHRVVQLQINKNKFLRLLGIDLVSLLVWGDSTVSHGQCIDRKNGVKFFLMNDLYGGSDEVADFHQLFLSLQGAVFEFDDFSLLAGLSRELKVLDPLNAGSDGVGAGLNINESALVKMLHRKAIELEINIKEKNVYRMDFLSEKNVFEIWTSDNEAYPFDFVVDVRSETLAVGEVADVVDWSAYFGCKKEYSDFKFQERFSCPLSEIGEDGNLIIKKTSLRTGVQYDCWSWVVEGGAEFGAPPFGRLSESWSGNYISLGGRAVQAGNMFVSELDLLLETIDLLLMLWDGKNFHKEVVDEFNRRVNVTYDSLANFHILLMSCWKGEEAWRYENIPQALREDLQLFKVCGKLRKVDGRFPGVHLWIAALMSLSERNCAYPLIGCDRDRKKVEEYLLKQKKSLTLQVGKAASHIDYINNVLGRFLKKNNHEKN